MNRDLKALTIVVPTLDEADNIDPLITRIDQTMRKARLSYKLLFIDDHSSDGTLNRIKRYAKRLPVIARSKRGPRGKAQSIIEGIAATDTPLVCMIDADLQYSPEEIPAMVDLLVKNRADVVLSTRKDHKTGPMRRLTSKAFNFLFTRMLFGIDYDTQSGLKVFRKNILNRMKLEPTPWAFDLEFIVKALAMQKRILTHDINFEQRFSGKAKVSVIKTSLELAKSSLILRARVPRKKIKDAYERNVLFNSKTLRAS